MWTPQGKLIRLRSLSPGAFGQPNSINDRGVIVGWGNRPGGVSFAYPVVWTSTGRAVELPVRPVNDKDDVTGVALAVNDRGTIMGGQSLNSMQRAILWKPERCRADGGQRGQAAGQGSCCADLE